MTAPHPIPRTSYAAPLARARAQRRIASAVHAATHVLLILCLVVAALQVARMSLGAAIGVPQVLEQARNRW